MPRQSSVMKKTALVVAVLGFMARGALATDGPVLSEAISPLPASLQTLTAAELFARLAEHNRSRELSLKQYTAVRTYQVTSEKGKVYAEEVVEVEYQAPGHKKFVVTREEGTWLVRQLAFKGLIDSESETSAGRAHHDSSIGPANYDLRLLGEQDVGPYHCIVAEALPKRNDKYLFRGRIWVDTTDYAIVRIAGQPAQKLSFWINRADFVRQYQKIGQFWLPAGDRTLVHVRLYGKKYFTIDYHDYRIDSAVESAPRRAGDDGPTSGP
jgi:outer membrane lipoprotein-sorting protein